MYKWLVDTFGASNELRETYSTAIAIARDPVFGPVFRKFVQEGGSAALRDIYGTRKANAQMYKDIEAYKKNPDDYDWRGFKKPKSKRSHKSDSIAVKKKAGKYQTAEEVLEMPRKRSYKRKRGRVSRRSKKRMFKRARVGVSKRFVRNSARAIMRHQKKLGPLITKRTCTSKRLNQETYNQATFTSIICNDAAELEGILNKGVPAILPDAAGTAFTVQDVPLDYDATDRVHSHGKLKVTGGGIKIVIRNNDLVDVDVTVVEFLAADHTATNPQSLFEESVEEKHFDNSVNHLSPMITFPPYARFFKDKWTLKQQKKFRINAGTEISAFIPARKGVYDSDFHQKHISSATYWKGISQYIIIRGQGTVVHDTADPSKVGLSKFQLDIWAECSYYYRPVFDLVKPRNTLSEDLDAITTGEQTNQDLAHENPI